MRIDSNTGLTLTDGDVTKTTASKAPDRALKNGAATETPAYSTAQSGIVNWSVAALSGPEVRSGRVEALRTAIHGGNYSVNPGDIANSILQQLRPSR